MIILAIYVWDCHISESGKKNILKLTKNFVNKVCKRTPLLQNREFVNKPKYG